MGKGFNIMMVGLAALIGYSMLKQSAGGKNVTSGGGQIISNPLGTDYDLMPEIPRSVLTPETDVPVNPKSGIPYATQARIAAAALANPSLGKAGTNWSEGYGAITKAMLSAGFINILDWGREGYQGVETISGREWNQAGWIFNANRGGFEPAAGKGYGFIPVSEHREVLKIGKKSFTKSTKHGTMKGGEGGYTFGSPQENLSAAYEAYPDTGGIDPYATE